MIQGIDTSVSTLDALSCLRDAGLAFVVRYYADHGAKRLTLAEARAISKGMDVVVVWESGSPTKPGYFSHAVGVADGRAAFLYGRDTIGQPTGTPIYFAVDYDAGPKATMGVITDYFRGVGEAFAELAGGGTDYEVGVYGSGLVCSTLHDAGLARFTWLAQSSGWAGSKTYDGWNMRQHLQKTVCGITVDPDDARPGYGGFRVS
ncbi:MAG TPA: glycoside hydrolase domain-containing protein [Longimicrobium sp.]|nr:glycoside hydrolase domain-containing protein [Longimicrobium sp.]